MGAITYGEAGPELLTSNTVHFDIAEPVGSAREARKLFLDALRAFTEHKYELSKSLYMENIKKHSETPYASRSFEGLITLCRVVLQDSNCVNTALTSFVGKHPNDGLLFTLLPQRLQLLGTEEDRGSYLRSIMQTTPASLLAKIADKIFKEKKY